MYLLIISLLTLPAVEAKYERVQRLGSFNNSGNSFLRWWEVSTKKSILYLAKAVNSLTTGEDAVPELVSGTLAVRAESPEACGRLKPVSVKNLILLTKLFLLAGCSL